MKTRVFTICGLIGLMFLLAPFQAKAQDYDQKVVLGFSLVGVHNFSKTDEVRDLYF